MYTARRGKRELMAVNADMGWISGAP